MLQDQNVICAFFFSAASNPFHKDHQREEAHGASNTSTLDAVGASGSLGSQPFTLQRETLSSHHEDREVTWMGLDKHTLARKMMKEEKLCQKK